MSLLHPIEAQRQHPEAWRHIEADIQEMREGTAGTFLPVAAEVMSEGGKELLHVVALTDFIAEGDEGWPATMSFKASLAPS